VGSNSSCLNRRHKSVAWIGGMDNERKTIVYVVPATNFPTGGIKVIIRHSEMISSMASTVFDSCICFPQNPSFDVTWMNHSAKVTRRFDFSPDLHFVMVPEGWAKDYGPMLSAMGIRFGIFVQNGYSLFENTSQGELAGLRTTYRSALVILSISRDTTECIKLAFPDVEQKICEVQCSIDQSIFYPGQKEDLITYVPRKLSAHSACVVSFLSSSQMLPGGWNIAAIDNVTEAEAARMLRRSRVFLSFCEREGLGLPPLEAAFCGNVVIGYTGEGAKDYWSDGIFTEIESGNIRQFVGAVVRKVNQFAQLNYKAETDANYRADLDRLKDRFSIENERSRLAQMLDIISDRWRLSPAHDADRSVKPQFSTGAESPVTRNSLCPCGSGKRYKHCHGRYQ
jgi:hypothetical protein